MTQAHIRSVSRSKPQGPKRYRYPRKDVVRWALKRNEGRTSRELTEHMGRLALLLLSCEELLRQRGKSLLGPNTREALFTMSELVPRRTIRGTGRVGGYVGKEA